MTRSRNARRGMTLVELMVTLVILAIVMAGTFQTLTGFQALYAASAVQRQAAASARGALGFIERDLRRAGLGIEPSMAFDFTVFRGFERDPNATDGAVTAPAFTALCGSTGSSSSTCLQVRDRTDGPDELVFYSRDAAYWGLDLGGEPYGRAWLVENATGTTLSIDTHGGEYFGRGQVIQVVCSRGAKVAYVTVSSSVTAPAAGGVVPIQVQGAQAGNPYSQPGELGTACLTKGARAFVVNRFRYHVRELHLAETGAGTALPFLVMDPGVDLNGDNAFTFQDLVPIAAGVVDLQVAYVRPTSGPPAQTFERSGATTQIFTTPCMVGVADPSWTIKKAPIAACGAGGLRLVDFATIGAGNYPRFAYTDVGAAWPATAKPKPPRAGADAANITAVEVHLTARSLATARNRNPVTQPSALNRAPNPAPAASAPAWLYTTLQSTIPVPNVAAGSISFL